MGERVVPGAYSGEERRRRWPGEHIGEERRHDSLAGLETDQEPDQSPLAEIAIRTEKDDGRARPDAAA